MRLFTENISETLLNSASLSRRQRPSIYQDHSKTVTTSPSQQTQTQTQWTSFKKTSRNSNSNSPSQSTHTNNTNDDHLHVSPSAASSYSPSFNHNPSFLTIPHSHPCPSIHQHHHSCSIRSESVPRKNSSSSSSRSTIDKLKPHQPRSNGRHTPSPGFRSASALSQVSFRSLRSINSRIKVRIQSFSQVIDARKPKQPELDWSALRAEYELHLARGSIIERCLVQVDLGPSVTERGRWWIDTVWTLADKLSPPLPAALAQYSASGLVPLLSPLRHTLHRLAVELPYNHLEDTAELDKFEELGAILRRAIWLAGLIENVIEIVSQVGLVRFELVGLKKPFDELKLANDDDLQFDDHHQFQALLDSSIHLISQWSGEVRGRTGSNNSWKGLIKLS